MISVETIVAGLGIRLSEYARLAMQDGISLGLNGMVQLRYIPPHHTKQDPRVEWALQYGIEIGRQVLALREINEQLKAKRKLQRTSDLTLHKEL